MSARLKRWKLASVSPGNAPPRDLLRGVKTHRLEVPFSLVYTVDTADAGAVPNPRGAVDLIERFRVLENGKPTVEIPRWAIKYIADRSQYNPTVAGEIPSAAALGDKAVSGIFVVDFAGLLSANPGETCYAERDSRFPVQVQVDFVKDIDATDLYSGITTLVLGDIGMTVNVHQMYDDQSGTPPVFLPRIRIGPLVPIPATQPKLRVDTLPEAGRRVFDTLVGFTADGILNTGIAGDDITVRDDKTIYDDGIDVGVLVNAERRNAPGATPTRAIVVRTWRQDGKLSECYNSAQGDNLRCEVDVVKVAGTNLAEVLMIEGESIPGYTAALPEGW